MDLDQELNEERRRAEGQFDNSEEDVNSDSDDEEEEEDWKKPSAYSLLMGSLKKNSKQTDFYKKIQREQEGIEDVISSEDENGLDKQELDNEREREEMKDEEEDSDEDVEDLGTIDRDAADPIEEEEEIVYAGSDTEAEDASGTCTLSKHFVEYFLMLLIR